MNRGISKTNKHTSRYLSSIFFQISILFILSHFLIFFSSIHHGQRQWTNLQKNGQYQLSTTSIKSPVSSSSYYQTSSSIELTITYVSFIIDKNQTNSVLWSKNSIQNDLNITSNYNIQSYETQKRHYYSIPTTSTPNHHTKYIAVTSVSF